MKIVLYILFSLFLVWKSQSAQDHYWRDWNGTLPWDAFVAGNDSRGNIYVAQAYLLKTGLYSGYIIGANRSIQINPTLSNGPLRSSDVIKILCVKPGDNTFYWLTANTTLTPTLVKYTPVVKGGVAFNNNTVYVARYVVNDKVYVGSVHTDYYAYYVDDANTPKYTNTYQLLIYALD
ncbi:hypothetical protein NQ317_006681 [Molorchus minor]|uniref:Uncharacterized protein n=1 Tax=Molorchus minor TaxID=1323400 RepID=A0ABQ9J9P6_9CUCU|nr:hypothetical protein NQ317_006681 [Molorchus minor]